MEINEYKVEEYLKVTVKGRLDTNTAPELEKTILEEMESINKLDLDFSDLDYISSAGLRVVLMLHKTLSAKKGVLKILHPKEEVMDVFDMTGFSSFLNIEE